MTANVSTTIVPGHGTLFIAPVNTPLPAMPVLSAFGLTVTPAGWENLGHTSKDNLFSFSVNGGDKTTLDSYLSDGIKVIYAAKQWTLGINSLQVDKNALDLAFNGSFDPATGGYIVPSSNDGLARALFLYLTDGTGSLGFYVPNTTITLGDAPSIDPAKFFEVPLSASILSADPLVIPAAANGLPGIMEIFKTSLAATVATITTALPGSQTTGDIIQLVGSSFVGTTAVTVGGVNAPLFSVVSDSSLYVTLPAGSSGSAPIIVTNAAGASVAKAYTRT